MFLLKKRLENYLQNKKLVQTHVKQITTELLIEVIKILEAELKQRIKEFENRGGMKEIKNSLN